MWKPNLTLRLITVSLIYILGATSSNGQSRSPELQPLVEVLGADGPFSYPQKAVASSAGNIYVLDTGLSNIFFLDMERAKVYRMCAPRLPVKASDMAVDNDGSVWILDEPRSKITKLNGSCEPQLSFPTQRPSRRLQVNDFGDIAVLTLKGDTLFDLYRADGQLIRSFGRRLRYGDPVADSELSDGQLISDRSGGFYFSFNYPPLVQHYGRDGRLIGEFKPSTDKKISPPNISSKREGRRLSVMSEYQILVLDMAVDERGRLLLLMSGEDKIQALTHGARDLLITTGRGKVLKKATVRQAFHRLAVIRRDLYLLRNRNGLGLVQYSLP